jgi:hypothetical protein
VVLRDALVSFRVPVRFSLRPYRYVTAQLRTLPERVHLAYEWDIPYGKMAKGRHSLGDLTLYQALRTCGELAEASFFEW